MPQHHPGEEGRKFGEEKYSDDELVAFMRHFFEEHGRAPKQADFIELSKKALTPSTKAYENRGGWNHFLHLAGLDLNKRQSENFDELSKPVYVRRFKEYLKQHPNATQKDIIRDSIEGLCPSVTILNHLGGLKKMRERLGVKVEKLIYFSPNEVVFLESLLAGKNQTEALMEAGYSKGSSGGLGILTRRFNVRSITDVLKIYSEWKTDQAHKNDETKTD